MMIWHWNGYGFKAMGTRVYIWFYSATPNSSEILMDIQATFDSMERRLSRFLPHSELSILNHATNREFYASPTLYSVLETAKWAAAATNGLFDPTILDALQTAGYNQSFETMDTNGTTAVTPADAVRYGQFSQVELRPADRRIIKPTGVKLDLGGIGKGWTVDRAADRLVGHAPFLVNAGGDLYAYGSPPNQSAWTVDIPHPVFSDQTIAQLKIADRAVATSSITRRQWWQGNTRMHHLIDPRTGSPADTDLLSVTVVAQRTTIAEVFAKTAVILGSAKGLAFLDSVPEVDALMVTADNRVLFTSQMARYIRVPELSHI